MLAQASAGDQGQIRSDTAARETPKGEGVTVARERVAEDRTRETPARA